MILFIEINKIHNMDCLNGIKLIEDESIDLIVIDPPYLNVVDINWDRKNPLNYNLAIELYRVLKKSGNIYIWCGIGEKSQSLIRFFNMFSKTDFIFKDLITWKKQRGIGMRKGWLYTREEILWYVKNNKKFVWNKDKQYSNEKRKYSHGFDGKPTISDYKRYTNVWTDITEESFNTSFVEMSSEKRKHLTPKPVKAIERIIELHTSEGDLVLDCFMGSGTTAIVCKKLNRNFIGIEISEEYCDIANDRISKLII